MKNKRRLSVSVDREYAEAAEAAVMEGRAPSVSAWVGDALRLKVEHDRRSDALAAFVAAHEAEHGVITDEEITDAARSARSRAVMVRGAGTVRGVGAGRDAADGGHGRRR